MGAVADRVAVVTADRERYGGLGIPIREDLVPDAGPLGGIGTTWAGCPSSAASDSVPLRLARRRWNESS